MSLLNRDISASDLNTPVDKSHKYNELEAAIASVNRAMLLAMLPDMVDMHQYGTPFLGSKNVVERFSKLNGLAVLRRNDSGFSDTLMAIILANWQSLASERGLAFLQFVLDMLYPGQNNIVRLWHSKKHLSQYPNYIYETQASDRFLTSRIRIALDNEIDTKELAELAPVFRRLVPWQIVADVAINFDIQEQALGLAAAVAECYHVGDFSQI